MNEELKDSFSEIDQPKLRNALRDAVKVLYHEQRERRHPLSLAIVALCRPEYSQAPDPGQFPSELMVRDNIEGDTLAEVAELERAYAEELEQVKAHDFNGAIKEFHRLRDEYARAPSKEATAPTLEAVQWQYQQYRSNLWRAFVRANVMTLLKTRLEICDRLLPNLEFMVRQQLSAEQWQCDDLGVKRFVPSRNLWALAQQLDYVHTERNEVVHLIASHRPDDLHWNGKGWDWGIINRIRPALLTPEPK